MSQSELARLARIPQTTVNSLIREDRRSSPHIIKLAAVLQTTPAYLACETDDPSGDAQFYFSPQEIDWMELLRGIAPKEREALMTIARALAGTAPSPTVHSGQAEYRAG